ncbi:MAG: RNA 2',3'-cyclic phosphodiesterase [Sphaerochaeta sp.]|nr:RNA 2',3'-cyclic phosphodiesterase [Sphaerochaeta sp.]
MRLFFALNFDTPTLEKCSALQQQIRPLCAKGTFTRMENLHLTLCFLGEIEEDTQEILKTILTELELQPLHLTFTHLGLFTKRGGDVLYLGLQNNKALHTVQTMLHQKLVRNGFTLENTSFTAHITLARRVHCKELCSFKPFSAEPTSISLMLSHRIDNCLTYTPLYTRAI